MDRALDLPVESPRLQRPDVDELLGHRSTEGVRARGTHSDEWRDGR